MLRNTSLFVLLTISSTVVARTPHKKKDLDLMSLATRYKQWSGRPLPASTIKQIEKSFSD